MRTLIYGGKFATPHHVLPEGTMIIEDGKIISVEQGKRIPKAGDAVIDANGYWVAPGLIDLHIHGAIGYDFMDASVEAIQGISVYCARHGVTSYLATTLSGPTERINAALANIANYSSDEGALSLGVHLEGPYLNDKHCGAQPERFLRKPFPQEYQAWFKTGVIRLITIAPECNGALEMIREGRSLGIEFAVGHSGATFEQVIEAVDHGLRHATHTFNGMAGLHHRNPGTVGAVLADDRIYAHLIPDGIHLHPALVKIVVNAKTIHRTVLITDSIRATGLGDGLYELGCDKVLVQDGIARSTSGSLAGSILTLDEGVRNTMRFASLSFSEALTMATSTPAASIGYNGRKGILAPGADADIIILDDDFNVRKTIVGGKLIFES